MVKIKTSSNEKAAHILLKKKAIEMLNNREDVIDIKTEYKIKKKRGSYYSFVDVVGIKNNGGYIFVEVKSDNTIPSAIVQLMALERGVSRDEFITICNFNKIYYFKSIWRNKLIKIQDFINKTKIYTFDEEYRLKHRDIKYKDGKELWIDGIKII